MSSHGGGTARPGASRCADQSTVWSRVEASVTSFTTSLPCQLQSLPVRSSCRYQQLIARLSTCENTPTSRRRRRTRHITTNTTKTKEKQGRATTAAGVARRRCASVTFDGMLRRYRIIRASVVKGTRWMLRVSAVGSRRVSRITWSWMMGRSLSLSYVGGERSARRQMYDAFSFADDWITTASSPSSPSRCKQTLADKGEPLGRMVLSTIARNSVACLNVARVSFALTSSPALTLRVRCG